jgi:hypothetical protein
LLFTSLGLFFPGFHLFNFGFGLGNAGADFFGGRLGFGLARWSGGLLHFFPGKCGTEFAAVCRAGYPATSEL